jgi:hypothetical protein
LLLAYLPSYWCLLNGSLGFLKTCFCENRSNVDGPELGHDPIGSDILARLATEMAAARIFSKENWVLKHKKLPTD